MKQQKKSDPFKNLVLDHYEKEIEASLERGEWKGVDNFEKRKKELREGAKDTLELRKSKRITLRVNQGDLIKLKAKAKRKNIPYQTLLNVLIRDFVGDQYSVKL